ncbi:hypothetical protein OIU84_018419 [Salix udensis]|uniref:J domain-containing protein n=1 Tax=Salix udensis TaxID=889485 RepID=A0AAD6KWN9_9ROSI|nr:hypothetical protein OIU84_018419 [Salix udensis]
MDGNKDEAIRCVRIAEEAIASGNKQRAFKFSKMAQRLNPKLSVNHLLSASEKLDSSENSASAGQNDHKDRNTNGFVSSDEGLSAERSYTEEHVHLIRHINRNKDYYGILGVEKSCSVEEIRKAYRKLSLKVHPDKNKAPGSEEAFKKLCKALKCLKLPKKQSHPATNNALSNLLKWRNVLIIICLLIISYLHVRSLIPRKTLLPRDQNDHKDRNTNGFVKSDEGLSAERSYTEEHVHLIRHINRNKDYYGILGVEKSCSVEEIRKAYRKLSLKVHPDKNKAPGSEEAFKKLCKAFKCLSDGDSRVQYDQTGLVDEFEHNQQYNNNNVRRRRTSARGSYYDDEFDPDEIFRAFFWSGRSV